MGESFYKNQLSGLKLGKEFLTGLNAAGNLLCCFWGALSAAARAQVARPAGLENQHLQVYPRESFCKWVQAHTCVHGCARDLHACALRAWECTTYWWLQGLGVLMAAGRVTGLSFRIPEKSQGDSVSGTEAHGLEVQEAEASSLLSFPTLLSTPYPHPLTGCRVESQGEGWREKGLRARRGPAQPREAGTPCRSWKGSSPGAPSS